MTLENCTDYVIDDYDDYHHNIPCKCPVCGGFLSWDETNTIPICNKCGAELITIPEQDEETGEWLDYGKICALSGRKKTKQQTKEEREVNRLVKEGAAKWKGWL